MEIRQLKYFVEICHCKSFSQAANLCFISPQGMSMSMMRLEEELGRKLFVRSPMGIALTPHAEFLLPKAKKILSIAEECEEYFRSDRQEESVLPISCSHGTVEECGGRLISEFQDLYPEIKLQIRECSDMDADEAVISDECELALTVGPLPKNRFDSLLLLTTNYILVVKEDDPLAKKKKIAVKDLEKLPLAIMKSSVRTYSYLKSACADSGFEPKIHTFCDNILLVFYLATLPGVYGITTQNLFKRLNPPGLSFVVIDDPDFCWQVFAIRKSGGALSAPADQLWKMISRHALPASQPARPVVE